MSLLTPKAFTTASVKSPETPAVIPETIAPLRASFKSPPCIKVLVPEINAPPKAVAVVPLAPKAVPKAVGTPAKAKPIAAIAGKKSLNLASLTSNVLIS